MERLSKSFLVIAILLQSACGVKGKPLPPLQPAHLGRGEPTFTEADKKATTSKKRLYRLYRDENETENSEE